MKNTNRRISFLLVAFGLAGVSIQVQSQWTYVDAVDFVPVDTATNTITLQVRAEAGEVEAQSKLAEGHLGYRRFDRGVKQDPIQAFKWACIASSNGVPEAKFLLVECRLFMSPEDLAEGKALAEAYLAAQDGTRSAKNESDDAQDASPELPPASAVLESSETMSPEPESEATAR